MKRWRKVILETIKIQKATPADLKMLERIGRETFYEAFASDNTEEDMQDYLNKNFSTAQLTTELNNPHSAFYFALHENAAIGYLKINTGNAQTELKNNHALEIERIYISKKFQGKNAGKLLFEQALEIAKQRKAPFLWLGVWEKNEKAIRFYERNGMSKFDTHIFKLGKDEQTDILMKLDLS